MDFKSTTCWSVSAGVVYVHELFLERIAPFLPAKLTSTGTALLVPDYTIKVRFEADASPA